jgi:peptidyl-prolyl cis-trans isomerase D
MLDLIRRKQKSVVVKVVFWVIIATFVGTIFLVWGKGGRGTGADSDMAVKVNGQQVTFGDFRGAYDNMRRLYQNIYRERFTPEMEKQLGLEGQALERLINQTLLLQDADDRDIEVSKSELVEAIAKIPAFQIDGAFNKAQYLKVLAFEHLSSEQFEDSQRKELLIEKVRQQIEEAATVSEEEIAEEYRRRNEKINLAFVRLAPALFEDDVKVTDEALQGYYEEHQEQFRVAERVVLDYLKFEPARYKAEVDLSDDALQNYYRRHQAQFDVAEQVKASHLLLRVDANAEPKVKQQKRQLAEKLLAQIKSKDNKNFAELARRYSDDAGSAVQGGALGYFTRGTMVPAFEEVAFSLQPGQLSDIVETNFGYHIILCQGHIEAGVKDLADVIDEVKAGIIKEQSRQFAIEKAMDAYNVHRKSGDLKAAAEANGLTVKTTAAFERGSTIPGIGKAPELNEAAFNLKENELGRPVSLADAIYLPALKERQPSHVAELAKVRTAVESAYRRQQSHVLARQAAEKLLSEMQGGKTLAASARKIKQQVEETDFFSRSYGNFVPRIGNAADVAEVVFELNKEKPAADKVFEVAGKFVVVAFKARQPADMDKLDEEKRAELEKVLLARKKENLLETRLQELRKEADIDIHPALLNSLKEEELAS